MTRRDALKAFGGVAAAGPLANALGACALAKEDTAIATLRQRIAASAVREPLAPSLLAGLHAYGEKSLSAGDTLNLRVSSDTSYTTSIVRLGWDLDSTAEDWVIVGPQAQPTAAAQQPILVGSYVHVDSFLPASSSLPAMSLEVWVRPFSNAWQGIISQYTWPTECGFGLFLGNDGSGAQEVYCYFGHGGDFVPSWLLGAAATLTGGWHHLVATFEGGAVALWIDGRQVATGTVGVSSVGPGSAPLRLAAYGENGAAAHTLDGDLAMPVVYSRALGQAEIVSRASQTPPAVPADTSSVLGCWPLTEESGDVLGDIGPAQRQGWIVNHATWMIGGPGFDEAAILPPGYVPSQDATRGHGLRFASDDFYDCGWSVTQSVVVPHDATPGLYVARFVYGPNADRYDVTFVVRRAADKPAPHVLVLCATNTWLAYNVPFPAQQDDSAAIGNAAVVSGPAPAAPGATMYVPHLAGAPAYQVGVEMPWGIAGPYITYLANSPDYGHLVRAERSLHVWLEKNGYDYDVVSDLDLHQTPSLLAAYRIVIINGHSEYWSAPAYDGLQSYLAAGGCLFVASGNTMFWRVSYDPASTVMECRKWPSAAGVATDIAQPGHLFYSQDGELGGLLRSCGRPAWQLTGLESVGWTASLAGTETFDVTQSNHVLLQEPEAVRVPNGASLGSSLAVGHEYDITVSEIGGAPIPSGAGPVVLANRTVAQMDFSQGYEYWDYACDSQTPQPSQPVSEIAYWQRPAGGRVFAAGSIAAGRGIAGNPSMGALARNVLYELGIAHCVGLFAVDTNQNLRVVAWNGTSWEPPIGSPWTDLGNLGVPLASDPCAVAWSPGRIAVMGMDTNGHLAYWWWDGGQWNYADLGAPGTTGLAGRPSAVGWGRDRLDIFARGQSGDVFHKSWDGQAWSGWEDLGCSGSGSPAAIGWQGTRLSVAALSSTGAVMVQGWDAGSASPSASGWVDAGAPADPIQYGPTMVAWGGNCINLFVVDTLGQLFTCSWSGQQAGPPAGWTALGGALASAPVVAVREGTQLSVFALQQDGTIGCKWWDAAAQAWEPSLTGWQSLGGTSMGAPATATFRGSWVSLVSISTDGAVHYRWFDPSTGDWNPGTTWMAFGSGMRSGVAALGWVGTTV
jgi:hypothetical protein